MSNVSNKSIPMPMFDCVQQNLYCFVCYAICEYYALQSCRFSWSSFLSNFVAIFRYQNAIEFQCKTFVFTMKKKTRKKLSIVNIHPAFRFINITFPINVYFFALQLTGFLFVLFYLVRLWFKEMFFFRVIFLLSK